MPNRILKESICSSETIEKLKSEEECFFYRLIVNCDDYGRLDARPSILLAKCFPLKIETMKITTIEKLLKSLITNKLIFLYCDDKYLQMATWEDHQQVRAKRSKYPQPTAEEIERFHMISDDCICPRNPIQSLSLSESNIYIPYEEIVNYLNEVCGTHYRLGKANKQHINARWSEGYSLDDFKTVINKKAAEWMNTEQAMYLRPETLFGTKFDTYLNQLEGKGQQRQPTKSELDDIERRRFAEEYDRARSRQPYPELQS